MTNVLCRTPHVVRHVGTDHHRFDRLVDWVDRWTSAERVRNALVQHGTSQAADVAESDYLPTPT